MLTPPRCLLVTVQRSCCSLWRHIMCLCFISTRRHLKFMIITRKWNHPADHIFLIQLPTLRILLQFWLDMTVHLINVMSWREDYCHNQNYFLFECSSLHVCSHLFISFIFFLESTEINFKMSLECLFSVFYIIIIIIITNNFSLPLSPYVPSPTRPSLPSLLFPLLSSPPSASVSEDGKASLQSDSSHSGCQRGCQEQPLARFALVIFVCLFLSLPTSTIPSPLSSSSTPFLFWETGGQWWLLAGQSQSLSPFFFCIW